MNRHLLCAWAAGLILLTGCAASRPQQADGSDSAAQSAQEQRPPYQFGVGYSGTGYTSAFQQWRDLVLEDTQGNLELVLYGENVLGEGDSMVKSAQQGTLSIAASSTSVCTSIIPQTAILDIPACFPEYCQPFQVYDGVFFEALNRCYNDQGLELLYLRTGEPWIISSVTPITALDQLDGLRLRTSGSDYHNKLYDALGVQRVENVGLSALAYILDEHGVDAIETTYTILDSQNLLGVQHYALRGPIFVMSSAIVMNYDAFHSLPSDYQDSLKSRLGEILAQKQTEMSTRDTSGLEICDLSQEDYARLRQLSAPMVEEILTSVDDSLVQALQEEIAQNQQEQQSSSPG